MTRLIEPTRRDLFRIGGAAAIAAATAARANDEAHAVWATGVVFDDRSRSGARGPDDPGIPDVLVSNGREVVRTGADGRYRLPVGDGQMLFVIKPSGWEVPVDQRTLLPKFHYNHQPSGTPSSLGLTFPGVEPTGLLPDAIDFPLRRAPAAERFDVIMFADPQPANAAEIGYIRATVASALAGADAAFGLTLGDIMSDDLSLYDHYNGVIGQIGMTWWNLPGNHDLNYDAPSREYSRETWKRHFGPTSYAFEHGRALFIMLDNVEWRGARASGPAYVGYIGANQLEFVRNVLRNTPVDRLIVVCMHIPLASAGDPSDPASNTSDRDALLELLGDRPSVSFSGHMHSTEHHYLEPRLPGASREPHHHHVLTAVSGSWWSGPLDARGIPLAASCDGTPNGWHVLSIDGTDYSTRFVSAREPAQIRIMLDVRDGASGNEASGCRLSGQPITRESLCNAKLIVNVFDGGPRTRVECLISDGPPMVLTREPLADPFTQAVFASAGKTKKDWVQAETSSHIWTTALPDDLSQGPHRITAKIVDEYGRENSGHLVFEMT